MIPARCGSNHWVADTHGDKSESPATPQRSRDKCVNGAAKKTQVTVTTVPSRRDIESRSYVPRRVDRGECHLSFSPKTSACGDHTYSYTANCMICAPTTVTI